jgi:hypothetical protein
MTCPWVIDVSCDQVYWDALPPAQQLAATAFATDVLWASTGRQFSACTMTVRPCMRSWGSWGWFGYNNGSYDGGWGWVPFNWQGEWFNGCGCGSGGPFCCEPRWHTQALLLGPVDSIQNITIDGVTLDPTAYRVDDGQWLVRTDGDRWPIHQDLNLDAGAVNTWTVKYLRGVAVPAALLAGAGSLAIQYAKACASDSTCRLNGRITSIVRQGIQTTFVDPTELLKMGLTGLEEVDLLIRSYNPSSLSHRLRLFSPDVEYNRVTTWQAT